MNWSGRPISRVFDLIPGNIELMEFEHDSPRALAEKRSGDSLFFRVLPERSRPLKVATMSS